MRASLRVFLCWFWQQSFFEILLRFVRSGKLLKCHHNRPKLRYRQLRIISIHCANMLRLDLTLCVMGIWDDYGRLRCFELSSSRRSCKTVSSFVSAWNQKKSHRHSSEKNFFFPTQMRRTKRSTFGEVKSLHFSSQAFEICQPAMWPRKRLSFAHRDSYTLRHEIVRNLIRATWCNDHLTTLKHQRRMQKCVRLEWRFE